MLFKTTSSYSRWWEARVLWGNGYIAVRSTLRLAISFVGRDHPELLPAMYRWTAAILPALAAYLRQRGHYFDDHLGGLLLPAELDWLRQRGIPPVAALQVRQSGSQWQCECVRLLGQLQLPALPILCFPKFLLTFAAGSLGAAGPCTAV
jgi:hypothetical protein